MTIIRTTCAGRALNSASQIAAGDIFWVVAPTEQVRNSFSNLLQVRSSMRPGVSRILKLLERVDALLPPVLPDGRLSTSLSLKNTNVSVNETNVLSDSVL